MDKTELYVLATLNTIKSASRRFWIQRHCYFDSETKSGNCNC
jgi:hypothetical protein